MDENDPIHSFILYFPHKIYDFAEDGAQSGVTGQGSAQVTHISEFSDEWKNGYFEFLRGFIHQEGLFNDALSINVGEHPTKWTLTVNGTCCRNTTTSVRSTSTWKNSRPPYGETSTSSTGVLSQGQSLQHLRGDVTFPQQPSTEVSNNSDSSHPLVTFAGEC